MRRGVAQAPLRRVERGKQAMRICVTSQGGDLEAQVDPRFGRARFFVFYDDETGQVEALDLGDAPAKVGAVQKTLGDETVVLYFNLGGDAATLPNIAGTLTASLPTGDAPPTLAGGILELPGLCIAVVAG